MRQTREELLQQFPSWNENKRDIVKVNYGDEPSMVWNKEEYVKWSKYNSFTIERYIWTQNGDYNNYYTLIGETYIKPDGTVLGGNVNVKYRGKSHTVHLNMMYGWKALDILRIGEWVVGFSNKDGQGSPSIMTKEMDKETIEKILNMPLEDYGYGIQRFMETARQVYGMDTTNYIMEKRFNTVR